MSSCKADSLYHRKVKRPPISHSLLEFFFLVQIANKIPLPLFISCITQKSVLMKGLIIIISVEISKVCVGIRLPSQVGIEVLVSFLQDQVVFVESLLGRRWDSKTQYSHDKRKPATEINGMLFST